MKLSQLSLADYNQLDNIPVINQDLSATDFTPVANTYYRHTGATTDTFTQGVIYLYDTAYHKLGESGGGISDVKVAGTSVVTDGVANIPISDKNVKGVVSDVVRKNSQFKLITGTYSSGYLSPNNQSKGFVLSKDGIDDEFVIYPNTTWGNIIYSSYQNSPLHLFVSAGDNKNDKHIGFYHTEIRKYQSISEYAKSELPNYDGTLMSTPSTWSSGTSGSVTLSQAGTYQIYAVDKGINIDFGLIYTDLTSETRKSTRVDGSLTYVISLGSGSIVITQFDTQSNTSETMTIPVYYRRVGI